MTVAEHAIDRSAAWPVSAAAPARQDAVRRAAVALADAAAALATSTALAAAFQNLPLRTALLVPVCWTLAAWAIGAYRHRRLKDGLVDVPALVRTAAILCALAGVTAAITPLPGARALVLIAIPAAAVASAAARTALLPLTRDGRALAAAPVIVVGPVDAVREFLSGTSAPGATACRVAGAYITDQPSTDNALTAELAAHGLRRAHSYNQIGDVVQQTGADTVVVVGGMDGAAVRSLAWDLEHLSVAVAVTPIWLAAPHRVSARILGGTTAIEVSSPRYYGPRLALRECIDRALAAVALVVFAPLLGAIALTIRLTSPGAPVLFSHHRTGKDGRRFRLLKFRTMVPNAEALKATLAAGNQYSDGTLFKIKTDPRITPVGRWLRKFSLDELPQLVNVVRGDMLLVGPRPTSTPPENMRADYYRRTLVKPGLTGLWQVSGRSDLAWEDAVRLDVHYVENRSLELDLDILVCRTLPAVLGRRGAY